MNPMVPYLTGWLAGNVTGKAAEVMKIVEMEPQPPDAFLVKLESGLMLRVKVSEVPKLRGGKE